MSHNHRSAAVSSSTPDLLKQPSTLFIPCLMSFNMVLLFGSLSFVEPYLFNSLQHETFDRHSYPLLSIASSHPISDGITLLNVVRF